VNALSAASAAPGQLRARTSSNAAVVLFHVYKPTAPATGGTSTLSRTSQRSRSSIWQRMRAPSTCTASRAGMSGM
jgi:hypothetical protein